MRIRTLVLATAIAMAVPFATGPKCFWGGDVQSDPPTMFSAMAAVPSTTPLTEEQLESVRGTAILTFLRVIINRTKAIEVSDGAAERLVRSIDTPGGEVKMLPS